MTETAGVSETSQKGPGETTNPQTPHSDETPSATLHSNTKGKRLLTAAFNMAVGAGVSMAVKSLVVGAVCAAGAPLLAATVAAAAAAGMATGGVKMMIDNRDDFSRIWKPENRKANMKKLAFHTGFTMLGALTFGLACEFGPGLLGKVFNFFSGTATDTALPATPAVVAAPAVIETPTASVAIDTAPVVAPQLTPLDRLGDIIAHDADASDKAKAALERARHGNPQALKDLGFFLFNGREGLDMNRPLAVDIFKEARSLGHNGAGIDLAYSEYHGLGNVPKSHDGGMYNMFDNLNDMDPKGQLGTAENKRGWGLLRAWIGSGNGIEPIAVPAAPVIADTVTAAPAIEPTTTPATVIAPVAPSVENAITAPVTPVATTETMIAPAPAETTASPSPATLAPQAASPAPIATEPAATAEIAVQPAVPVTPAPVAAEVTTESTASEMATTVPSKMACTPIISGENISWHCTVGKDAAIVNNDKIRLLMMPGRR